MKKKLLASLLAVTMLVGLFPIPALAAEEKRPEWTVTAFDPLDEGAAFQAIPQGGGEPLLPDTLTAWAYRIEDDTTVIVPPEQTAPEGERPPVDSPEEQPGPGEAGPAPAEDGGDVLTAALAENAPAPAEQQEPDIQQITIPGVTWTAEPEYGHNVPGVYRYTPVLPAAYIVDEGVELPAVTVTVAAAREQTPVERVQALIDALPDPEGITLDNRAGVEAQLAAISEAWAELTGEEAGQLDTSRCEITVEMLRFTGNVTLTNQDPTAGSDDCLISTPSDLENFRDRVNSGETTINGKLTADIDLSQVCGANVNGGTSWAPIGSESAPFNGTFDGNGYKIQGLYINTSNTYQGLFAYVGETGEVKNLGLAGGSVKGGDYNIGGIAGTNRGIMENCYNTGTVSGTYMSVGGVAGANYGSVTGCYNTGNVSGSNCIGGVIGFNQYGTVKNCYNAGDIVGTADCVAGIAGYSDYNTMLNCCNIGNISGGNANTGGVIGGGNEGTAENCYYRSDCILTAEKNTIGTSKTDAEFASGAVTHLLQGSQPDYVWGLKNGSPVLMNTIAEAEREQYMVYKVTFIDRGREHTAAYANSGNSVNLPTGTLINDGYVFAGWYDQSGTGGIQITSSITATQDKTVYAHWKANKPQTPMINYMSESISATPETEYSTDDGTNWNRCTADMKVTTLGWDGTRLAVQFRIAATGDYHASDAVSITVPARPAAPGEEILVHKTENAITVTNAGAFSGCEFSADGTNWQDSAAFTGLSAGQTYTLSVREKAATSSFASASKSKAVTTVAADGSTTVKPGESVEVGTPPKTTVTSDGEEVTITTGGTAATVTPAKEVEVGGDGSVTVPGGSAIKPGNGGPEITVGPGNGGTIGNNGEITIPGGGGAQVGNHPSTTITVPAGGGTIKPSPDGTVDVPEGSTVQTGDDGPEITVGPGNGGTVGNNGGVTIEGGGKVTVEGDPDDTTITLPSGGTVGGDGSITVPDGGTIQVDGATIIPPSGGVVKPNGDGTIIVPGGSTIEKPDGTTVTVPIGGGIFDPGTGEVTQNVHTVTGDMTLYAK